MSAVAVARRPEGQALSLFEELEEPTLDMLMAGMWRELEQDRAVSCPMCGSEMRPRYGAHRWAVAARCESCGTTLA